ncbi:MAG: Sm1 protein [Candidatus Aramenus sulfurataquae]|uniref:Sm ribonucleo n=2 Tax=Candidatus Aramenus sulfurataquae TaxID=1326980 RepID=W7KVQ4_9CREN|nr:MAG: Sm1 protein [Candidatus Aramenus sulfurataquae]MBW9140634.1 ribonucleoprotein [Candidatus Aramenus sp.]MCL7343268.1 U6 snRNA-associated Sm-like protein LSm6 [Candidatus Aramenus sulfurataquae]
MQTKVENPLKNLRSAVNKIVLVKLKDGSEYIGRLEQTDGTMNLVLRDCTEMVEGSSDPVAKYGRVLIRGSNILFVSVDYESIMDKEK